MTVPAPARLAAWLDSYRCGLAAAIESAASDGFGAVQANTAGQSLQPAEFSRSARRDLARRLSDLGLTLDALAVAPAEGGLADPHYADQRFDLLRQTLDLARDTHAGRVVMRLGPLESDRTRDLARELLAAAAELADRRGVKLAVEPEADALESLSDELRRLDCPLLALALDSAWPEAALHQAAAQAVPIACAYLRDVRRQAGAIQELPFGQGQVDFRRLLAELAGGAWEGSCTIRLFQPPASVDALRRAREYVESLIRSGR